MKKILVTGGAGYIGSHTVLALIEAGFHPVVIDDFSNSSEKVFSRLKEISGEEVEYHSVDVCDVVRLRNVFEKYNFSAVIHFAGLKAVGESSEIPVDYYSVNVAGTLNLLKVMKEYNTANLVFSSSATVYGPNNPIPYVETMPTEACNPYGRTKLFVEHILRDECQANEEFSSSLLRYFNPIGAHPSGLIGEDPSGIPNNLMPYITQVAVGKREQLGIFGDDYKTIDGTGVRDYLHVVDLAEAHVLAMKTLITEGGLQTYNLGTGSGTSVLQMVQGFEKVNKVKIPYQIAPRRDGDIDEFYANPSLAKDKLGWEAKLTLEDMLRDSWNWQKNNPNGYE